MLLSLVVISLPWLVTSGTETVSKLAAESRGGAVAHAVCMTPPGLPGQPGSTCLAPRPERPRPHIGCCLGLASQFQGLGICFYGLHINGRSSPIPLRQAHHDQPLALTERPHLAPEQRRE
jgi:hypothetical protein